MSEAPYISSITYDPVNEIYDMEGSFADMLLLFKNTMNFTYKMLPPLDDQWGSLLSNGSWTGMIRQLKDELVDFGNYFFKRNGFTIADTIMHTIIFSSSSN